MEKKQNCSLIENFIPKDNSWYIKTKARRICLEIDFIVTDYMSQLESIQTTYDQRQLTKIKESLILNGQFERIGQLDPLFLKVGGGGELIFQSFPKKGGVGKIGGHLKKGCRLFFYTSVICIACTPSPPFCWGRGYQFLEKV